MLPIFQSEVFPAAEMRYQNSTKIGHGKKRAKSKLYFMNLGDKDIPCTMYMGP